MRRWVDRVSVAGLLVACASLWPVAAVAWFGVEVGAAAWRASACVGLVSVGLCWAALLVGACLGGRGRA